LVKSDTFRNIIDEFDGRSIVIPTFGGKKGHPVLFPSEMRNILLKTEDKSGIRAAIANYNSRVKYLEVRDEAILWNIDTKEDLKKCQMR
jgi:CTP:molybdopterin cytidylyltransferase MocA